VCFSTDFHANGELLCIDHDLAGLALFQRVNDCHLALEQIRQRQRILHFQAMDKTHQMCDFKLGETLR
jgi:hypothetical protein